MNINKLLSLFVFTTFISACSASQQYAKESLQGSQSCCKSMAEFEFKDLPTQELYIADINEKSPSFDFDTGKSYFISLKLPDFTGTYTLTIKSFALGESIDSNHAHIFAPKVLLLDDVFAVVNEDRAYTFDVAKASIAEATKENSWGLPIKLEGPVLIDKADFKYLVILTTDSLSSGTTPYETLRATPVILPGIVTAIPTHKEIVLIPHSAFGRITIRADH